MTNIAILGSAVSALQAGGGNALADIQTSAEGGSFKGILGEMMNTSSDSITDSAAAEAYSPKELSADSVTEEVMSESTENTLKYLVGSYLQSAAKSSSSDKTGNTNLFDFLFTSIDDDDNTDYTDIWQQLFDSLTSTDITQLSSFSAELSTALFGGGKNEEKSSGDILTELFASIDENRLKVQTKISGDDLALAALASGGFSSVIGFADFLPEAEQSSELDMQLAALIGAADNETIEGLAADLAEAVTAATENMSLNNGSFSEEVNILEAKSAAPAQENAQLQANPAEVKMSEPAESISDNITFISFVRRSVRPADISEASAVVTETEGRTLPKIELDFEDLSDEFIAAQNGQPKQTETVQMPEEIVDISEETGFKTMEQIIARLEEQAEGFTESKELVIRLTPETLGEIAVKIEKAADGAVSITFAAQNRNVNELIADRSAQLAQALFDKGAEVSSINVVEPAQSGQNLAFDMSGQQNAFNFRQQGMGYHYRVDGRPSDDEETDGLSVSGIDVDTNSDYEYISKEAKLWTRV